LFEADTDEVPLAATAAVVIAGLGECKSNSIKECGVYSYNSDYDSRF